jgi:ABC-2 type transport system ATP-binding protein
MSVAVKVDKVSKTFRLHTERNQNLKSAILRGKISRYEEFTAVNDVSFDIYQGETIGLIGSNGSGKSTLLKCLARIYSPDRGQITYTGKIAALLEVGSGFHHELSGRENVYLNGSILGMKKKEIDAKFDEIVDFSGIRPFIDQPIKTYSSGMYVRLGFSIAISIKPEILVVDEILAVGDEDFQRKCFNKFTELKQKGTTIILVSHSMGSVEKMCDRVVWLEKGDLKQIGKTKEVVKNYLESI